MFLRIFLPITLAAVSTAYAVTQSERESLFKQFASDKYFKNATCREFADYNLTKNGLPKLGDDNGPVHGSRLSSDRHNEMSDPPEFMDSVLSAEKSYRSYQIAGSGNKSEWHATVDREIEVPTAVKNDHRHLRVRTTYHFQILDYNNTGSCALIGFDFQSKLDGDRAPIKKSVNLDACLDFFLTDNPNEKNLTPVELKTLSFLRDDCSMSMHYSLDAKKILAKPSH